MFLAQGKPYEAEKQALETINSASVSMKNKLLIWRGWFWLRVFSKPTGLNNANKFSVKSKIPILHRIFSCWAISREFAPGSHLHFKDEELALHHLNRSLTMFETSDDFYHTALIHYLIGKDNRSE